MSTENTILFILNPISGGKKKENLISQLERLSLSSSFKIIVKKTEYAGHASEIADGAVAAGIQKIIAVGGDGTVNEIGKRLVGTSTALGIIPFGSGNGLARHLGIPMNTEKALQLVFYATEKKIDVGYINDKAFFCTAGIGFDAHIGQVFSTLKGRGLAGYIKSVLKEYFHYISEEYTLELGNKKTRHHAFLLTAANAGQFGNNVYIAPQADIQDGLLDISIVRPFSIFRLPSMAWRVLNRSIHKSSFTTTLQESSFTIHRKNKGAYHVDGEPYMGGKEFSFTIKKAGLTMLVPPTLL